MSEGDFQLNRPQIKQLLKFARPRDNDVFYDLGCGDGQVIIELAKVGHYKKAVGLEYDKSHYTNARRSAIRTSSRKRNRLYRIEIWYGYLDYDDTPRSGYDISDATVVFNSLEETDEDEVKFYKKQFVRKRVRILKKDLPLVGYKSIADRNYPTCWFFRMSFPLKRIRSKDKWIRAVLGRNARESDVYKYYENQLTRRDIKRREITKSVKTLRRLVRIRFRRSTKRVKKIH